MNFAVGDIVKPPGTKNGWYEIVAMDPYVQCVRFPERDGFNYSFDVDGSQRLDPLVAAIAAANKEAK